MNRKKYIICGGLAAVLLLAVVLGLLFVQWEKPVYHTVTFQDFDGTVLKTEAVKSGCSPAAPAEPQREGYTFAGWNRGFSSVTKDITVIAEYIRHTETIFTVDTVTVAQGAEQAEVKVSVRNNPGILGAMFSLEYDESIMALTDAHSGQALAALTYQNPSRYQSGCNFLWYGSETGEAKDGEILVLTFDIAEAAAPGIYPITIKLDDENMLDENCDLLNPDVVQGGITITE